MTAAVVAAAVEAAGLGALRSIDRRTGGASNEVAVATLRDGSCVVARSARGRADRYRMEQLVMARAASVGVPVPEVLAVVSGDPDVMIEAFVEGVPVDRAPDPAAVAWRCGEVLARIHGLAVEGFGNLGPDGRGVATDFATWFGRGPLPDVGAPVLVHGDFSPGNVLLRGAEVVAVLDWESAKGGPPALEFGWWEWITTHGAPRPFPAEAMFEGYESVRPLDRSLVAALTPLVFERIARRS